MRNEEDNAGVAAFGSWQRRQGFGKAVEIRLPRGMSVEASNRQRELTVLQPSRVVIDAANNTLPFLPVEKRTWGKGSYLLSLCEK